MTEREFLQIVASLRRIEDQGFLDRRLEDTPFDSLDLLELRAALEIALDRPLSDEKFDSASTLRDLYRLACR